VRNCPAPDRSVLFFEGQTKKWRIAVGNAPNR
jgi:hypothetical protein